ncbi:hypothetical protein [Mycetohabitans endofungorum]|nr:hypothetical protein [Mycetohabitans endofungorum]
MTKLEEIQNTLSELTALYPDSLCYGELDDDCLFRTNPGGGIVSGSGIHHHVGMVNRFQWQGLLVRFQPGAPNWTTVFGAFATSSISPTTVKLQLAGDGQRRFDCR